MTLIKPLSLLKWYFIPCSHLATQVSGMESCLTSLSSPACTASYGAPALLPSSGGDGLIGWIHQLSGSHFHSQSASQSQSQSASHS